MVRGQGSARVVLAAAWITAHITAAQHLAERSPEHRALSLAESLSPYLGPVAKPNENTTLAGKAMCGYQGWFMARGDGYGQGFVHWGAVDRDPPRCTVDFWPDMSELEPHEHFPTNFRYTDGTRAAVFSSTVPDTVHRHFRWMREYGIAGAFVQRFTSYISDQTNWNYQRACAVLHHCRAGANRHGRTFAVMYDTSFDRKAVDAVKADWIRLIGDMKLTQTPAYARHRGAAVVSLWGYGFGHRRFEETAAEDLFRFLKQPENGGCTIMLGVPNDWVRWQDARMRLLKEYATVISPWTVGRYGSPEGARRHAERHWPDDLAFCREHDKDYYAVAFPGFSWTNLTKGASPLNQIPRLGGRFFWRQIEEIRRYGMDMVYLAMFDEADEGTAFFKCTNTPPVGRFCTYEGLPSDYYLRLAGLAGRYLRGENVTFPEVKPDPDLLGYKPLSALEFYKEPSPFRPDITRRWRVWFENVPMALHEGPYSDWIHDLHNSGALRTKPSSWDNILGEPATSPLLLLASGAEHFNAPSQLVPRIVRHVRDHLKEGGTVLVLSGGRYPLFYPDQGRQAAGFGFRLAMIQSPPNSRVVFDGTFSSELEPWTMAKGGGSRLMRHADYPDARSYRSLGRVLLPDGSRHGDAIAAVQPGGDLGRGRIVYVAGDLQR